jgi:ABC-type amino acid transport substrate-binding protein
MIFKKIIYSILFFCFSGNIAFASVMAMNTDLQEIVKDGKLTVAFVPSLSTPYVYYDADQQLQGFDVELAKHIAKALSVTLEPVIATNYNQAVELVANKQAELAISNITRTPARGKYVLFSKAYNTGYFTVLENRQNATAIDITREKIVAKYNQQGYVLGVIEGSVFGDLIKDYFSNATLKTYTNEKQMLIDIADKKINAAFTDYIIGKTLLKKSPEIYLSVTTTKVTDWILEDGIVMDMAHINLMYWINLFLITLEQDGTLKNMRAKYFNNVVVK